MSSNKVWISKSYPKPFQSPSQVLRNHSVITTFAFLPNWLWEVNMWVVWLSLIARMGSVVGASVGIVEIPGRVKEPDGGADLWSVPIQHFPNFVESSDSTFPQLRRKQNVFPPSDLDQLGQLRFLCSEFSHSDRISVDCENPPLF